MREDAQVKQCVNMYRDIQQEQKASYHFPRVGVMERYKEKRRRHENELGTAFLKQILAPFLHTHPTIFPFTQMPCCHKLLSVI